jgi:hypothetical protein
MWEVRACVPAFNIGNLRFEVLHAWSDQLAVSQALADWLKHSVVACITVTIVLPT